MSADGLESLITPGRLLQMAREVTYARGAEYVRDGRVHDLAIVDGILAAQVDGTETYRVRLFKQGEGLEFDCTCPVGNELRFCKHCVAAGLAWLIAQGEPVVDAAPKLDGEDALDRIRAFLEGMDAPALRDLLLAQARADEGLRERLLLREAAQAADPAAVKRMRAAIDRAVPAHVDYYDDAEGDVDGLNAVVDGLGALMETNPAAVVELAEHAIDRVEDAMASMHEADGMMDVLENLQQLHLEACLEARPDPVFLAARLLDLELRSEYDSFSRAAEAYAEVLGESGLAEYRRLLQPRWDRLPPLGPGVGDGDGGLDRWSITRMMEALTRATGTLDDLVDVKRRDLSSAYRHLEIAELYRDAGRHDEAMEWGRRGLDAFPASPDRRLEHFLAEEHHRRGEHAAAMEFVWAGFERSPSFEGYKGLHDHASRGGAWAAWRERALAALRKRAQEAQSRLAMLSSGQRGAFSELVRVALWEEDVETAWREAVEGGCSAELWVELAKKREDDHPRDSLDVYLRQVDAILVQTGDRAYAEAVRLLPSVCRVMERLEEDFGRYLAGLREKHRRRRNLLAMLDRLERRPAAA